MVPAAVGFGGQLLLLAAVLVLLRRIVDVSAVGAGTALLLELGLFGVASAVGLVLALVVTRRLDGRPLCGYGIHVSRGDLVDGVAGIAIGGLTYAVPTLAWLLLGDAELTGAFVSPVDAPGVLLAVVVVTGLAFVAQVSFEEFAFRGVMLQNFSEGLAARRVSARWAVAAALFASSVLFGLLHVVRQGGGGVDGRSVQLVVASTVLGLLWGGAYVLTGRLSMATGLHLGHNLWPALVLRPERVVLTPPALGTVVYDVGLYELTAGKVGVGAVCLVAWLLLTRESVAIDGHVPHRREAEDGSDPRGQ